MRKQAHQWPRVQPAEVGLMLRSPGTREQGVDREWTGRCSGAHAEVPWHQGAGSGQGGVVGLMLRSPGTREQGVGSEV